MRTILLLSVISLLFSCGSVEDRIKDHSYTTAWYYEDGQRYQVYSTLKGTLYIIKINKRETKLKRQYIKII